MINKLYVMFIIICMQTQGFSFDPLMLESNKSFEYTDLGLSEDESEKLSQLNIETTSKFDQFGKPDELEERLLSFMENIGTNDPEMIKNALDIITRLARQVMASANKNSAWVSVRSFAADASSDTPRWHIDGGDYGLGNVVLYPRLTYKFAATLKGPSTYLYDLTTDQRSIFLSCYNDRAFLNQFLDINLAESAQAGQGVFFIVGDNDKGAVHSEPIFNESRLFFSVVVGDESEIEDLYNRRTMQVRADQSWEESLYWTPPRPESTPAFWVQKIEQQNTLLRIRIENFISQFNKTKDLIESSESKLSKSLFDHYIGQLNHAAHGIDLNELYKDLDRAIPSPNKWTGSLAPMIDRSSELDYLDRALGWRIEELRDLSKEINAL